MINEFRLFTFGRTFYFYLEKGIRTTISGFAFFILIEVLLLTHGTASAQQQRTAKLKFPIESGSTPQVLLDTVFTVMDRWSKPGDSLRISRRTDGEQMTASELRRTLIDETGIVPNASSHIFISYRFSLAEENFKEEITSLQYVFIPPRPHRRLDLLYLSPSSRKWVQELIQKASGFSFNAATSKPFYHQLSFLRLLSSDDAEVQQIGGESANEEEKEKLVNRIRAAAGLSQ